MRGGNWDKVNTRTDVDGNTVEPIAIAEYLDRLWVIPKYRNVVLHSANLKPENLSDSTYAGLIQLSPGNGGYPTGWSKTRGFLYAIHEDYMALITGSSPSTFEIAPGNVIHGYGTSSRRSIVSMKRFFSFLNTEDNEIYLTDGTLDGTQKTPLSWEVNLKSLINPNKAQDTVGVFHDDLLRYSYVGTGDSQLNKELIYSLVEEKWCGETEDRFVSCYSPWNGFGDKNELVTGRSDLGTLMMNGQGLNFDNQPIHYKLKTGSYEIDEIRDAIFEYFYVDASPGGAYTIPLRYFMDTRISTEFTESVNMEGEEITLGLISIKDQEVFLNQAFPKIDNSRGRMIRFEIEETVKDRTFELYSIYGKYNLTNPKITKVLVGK